MAPRDTSIHGSGMGKLTVSAAHAIDAPLDEVWRILSDVAAWPTWNPYVRESRGELRVGEQLDFTALPGGVPRRFTPEVLEVEAPRRVRYRHRALYGALLDADHVIELRADAGKTIVEQRETFGGALPPMIASSLARDAKAGFETMNHALAQCVVARRGKPDLPRGRSLHAMRAIVLDGYGGPEVLHVAEVPTPAPRATEVLVRVLAAGLNQADAKRRKGELGWLVSAKRPNVLGYDVAGEVVAVGGAVSGIALGDHVFGMRPMLRGGGYAEYAVLDARSVARVPKGIDPVCAAVTPLAGMTALQALRDHGGIREGAHVYIAGAAGGVGTFAVQIARLLGAKVTAASSADAHAMLRSLGASETVDRMQGHALGTRRWDVVFDAGGALDVAEARRHLAESGVFVTIVPSPKVFAYAYASRAGLVKPAVRTFLVDARRADLEWLASHLASGALKPVVEKAYRLDEARLAHERLSSGRVRGKLAFVIG